MNKRTQIDFSKHELLITKQEGLLIHHLKKPDTMMDNIKFINTNGILAVTGDYGNWMFCREFHPSSDSHVSDGYWKEKLQILSSQEPNEFDEEETKKEIQELLKNEEEGNEELSEEEKEYLEGCLEKVEYGQFDYEWYAHRENCGRFFDHEYVPHSMKTKFWLTAVFDGFEEICERMKKEQLVQQTINA